MNKERRDERDAKAIVEKTLRWEALPGTVTPGTSAVVQPTEVTVGIDGVEVQGVEIDTDPLVYGVGASLGQGGVLTAVLPRDELDYIRIEFAKRP